MSARLVCSLCLVGPVVWIAFARSDKAIGQATLSEELPVIITLRLNKSEVTPEETVRLEQLVPAEIELEIGRSVWHDVIEIGRYDKQSGCLVAISDPRFYRTIEYTEGFDELPRSLGASHPIPFKIKDGRHKGIWFEFRSRRLGIFLITATWSLCDGGYITSQPVVLVVKPPLDEKGRPIVKPEWLREIPSVVEIVEVNKDK
ncbi:hypothetical protein HRbin36_00591 [bacterium HR36]|nr:hypothetical protein HRbin36_00591 [bacterium HR36]